MRIILMTALAASSVVAAPITSLYSTGQNGISGIDQNWAVNGGQAFVTDQSRYPFPLWTKMSVASWISPQADYDSASDAPDTTFIFSTMFNMPAHFESASVLMLVAADNALQDVQLNGISLEYLAAMTVLPGNTFPTRIIADGGGLITGFGPSMKIASGLRSGLNKLDFVVRNSATDANNSGNPSGLMVAFTSDVGCESGAGVNWLVGLRFGLDRTAIDAEGTVLTPWMQPPTLGAPSIISVYRAEIEYLPNPTLVPV